LKLVEVSNTVAYQTITSVKKFYSTGPCETQLTKHEEEESTLKPKQVFSVEFFGHLQQKFRSVSVSGLRLDGNISDQDGDDQFKIRSKESVRINSEL